MQEHLVYLVPYVPRPWRLAIEESILGHAGTEQKLTLETPGLLKRPGTIFSLRKATSVPAEWFHHTFSVAPKQQPTRMRIDPRTDPARQ